MYNYNFNHSCKSTFCFFCLSNNFPFFYSIEKKNSPNGKDGRYECRAENLLGHKSEHFDTHSKIGKISID